MNDSFLTVENLTASDDIAGVLWRTITNHLMELGRGTLLNQNSIILDIGGGKGVFSKYLNKVGLSAVSLDIKDIPSILPESNPVRASAYEMPFGDASFDLVNGRGVFDIIMYEHDFGPLVEEIARVLKPGGVLSIFDMFPPPATELEKHFTLLYESEFGMPILWEKKK